MNYGSPLAILGEDPDLSEEQADRLGYAMAAGPTLADAIEAALAHNNSGGGSAISGKSKWLRVRAELAKARGES